MNGPRERGELGARGFTLVVPTMPWSPSGVREETLELQKLEVSKPPGHRIGFHARSKNVSQGGRVDGGPIEDLGGWRLLAKDSLR